MQASLACRVPLVPSRGREAQSTPCLCMKECSAAQGNLVRVTHHCMPYTLPVQIRMPPTDLHSRPTIDEETEALIMQAETAKEGL